MLYKILVSLADIQKMNFTVILHNVRYLKDYMWLELEEELKYQK